MDIKDKFKVAHIGSNIYVYKGSALIASYSKETKRLYTYGLSKNEKRKVIKIIKAKLRNTVTESNNKMVIV